MPGGSSFDLSPHEKGDDVVTLPRRLLLFVVAALTALMMVAGPSAAKAEAKHCVKAKARGAIAKVCGKKATAKAGGGGTRA